jgi:hypothetical protein
MTHISKTYDFFFDAITFDYDFRFSRNNRTASTNVDRFLKGNPVFTALCHFIVIEKGKVFEC